MDADSIPGAVVLVKKYDKVIFEKAFGYAQKYNFRQNLIEPLEKMTTRHLFDIASLTKVVGTTISIMLLVDRGLLSIDDPVCKYVSFFSISDKSTITIRNLLTHTAGLREWYPLYYFCANKEQSYQLIGRLPLKYGVGVERHYSDLGFIILGDVVEQVSKLSLQEFMLKNIFEPLRMTHTGYLPLQSWRNREIAATSQGNPYEKRMVYDSSLGFSIKGISGTEWNGWRQYTLRGEVNDGNAWYANKGVSGAAGLFSTIEDLQILIDMLVAKGTNGNMQFVKPATIDNFLIKDKFNNGLGWMMDPNNSFMKNAPAGTYGHTGFTGTSIVVIPSIHTSLILLTNRQNRGLVSNGEYYNVNPLRSVIFELVNKYLE